MTAKGWYKGAEKTSSEESTPKRRNWKRIEIGDPEFKEHGD